MNILMCKPKYYNINYEINPWMNKNIQVYKKEAIDQWEHLNKIISECQINIQLIDAVNGLPDLVFTANAALLINNTAYLSQFRHQERQGETLYNRQWFVKHDITIDDYAIENNLNFEGEGDALFAGKEQLFVGYGFRSEKTYFSYLEQVIKQELICCELIDPYFYHLDTCFCPIDENTAIWWPQAFSESSQKVIRNAIEVIDVSVEEAKRFCCNAIVSDKNIIIPAGCNKITTLLEQRGFNVLSCPMSEYIKAGGACKCLTLILD